MNKLLSRRQPELREKMDDPKANPEQLRNTYHYFKTTNRLVSGWNVIFRKEIEPLLREADRALSLLDIGCGGGDVSEWLWQMSRNAGFEIEITAIDIDQRAIDYASQHRGHLPIRFQKIHTSTLIEQAEKFDLVISNHVLHHLSEEEIARLLLHSAQLAKCKVLFNDIERSLFAYYGFSAITRVLFPSSFIRQDGLTSICRSFRKEELQELLTNEWQVTRPFPFRLLTKLEKQS